jgi:hypothetical protein
MRIISRWTGNAEMYRRLARVLEHSARERNPSAVVDVANTDPEGVHRSDAFIRKAQDWTRAVVEAKDHEWLALLDTDTLILGEIVSAFYEPFDIAVTTRGDLSTLNSGVVFVRVNDLVREFFAPWAERTAKWCERNRPDRVSYGDQDALRDMVRKSTLRFVELPCMIWNAQQDCWSHMNRDTRILHLKSDARRIVFGGEPIGQRGAEKAAALWTAAEASMLAAPR